MSPDISRQRILNISIVLLIVVIIIAAAYLFLANSTNSSAIYSVDDIMNNPEEHIGKNITVKGYYNSGDGTITSSILPSGQQSTVIYKRLLVNISAVNLSAVGGSLASNTPYLFTGFLKSIPGTSVTPQTIILVVAKIVNA